MNSDERLKRKEKELFSVGGLQAGPGEKKQGWLELAGGQFVLPAALIRGKRPGKTVLITAGSMAENMWEFRRL